MSLKLSFASAERCNRSKDNQFTILNGHAGTRIEVNEATDILTFSPNGDYVRVNPKPDHPIGEQ